MKFKSRYYEECYKKAIEYQDFVTLLLLKEIGIPLSNYGSKKYQDKHGENAQGIEIKFDDRYESTGNIYIEVSEKSHEDNPYFVKSGIYRSDNTWIYLIGNYFDIYIFSKKHLKLMHTTNKFKQVETKTSKGFLIPKKDAEKYCIKKIQVIK